MARRTSSPTRTTLIWGLLVQGVLSKTNATNNASSRFIQRSNETIAPINSAFTELARDVLDPTAPHSNTQEEDGMFPIPDSANLVKKQGQLVSLVFPPTTVSTISDIPITKEQRSRIEEFKKKRNGLTRISYRREFGPFDGVEQACGMGYINSYFSTKGFNVAVSKSLYGDAHACGLCVRLFCTDSICPQALMKSEVFMITDECADCEPNDLVASIAGFTALTQVDPDINSIVTSAFDIVSCKDLISGNIKMLISPDVNKQYLGINFSNVKVPIKAVRFEGYPLQLQRDGFWSIRSKGRNTLPFRPPYILQIASIENEVIQMSLDRLENSDLGTNFHPSGVEPNG